jgi:hypothetical protein
MERRKIILKKANFSNSGRQTTKKLQFLYIRIYSILFYIILFNKKGIYPMMLAAPAPDDGGVGAGASASCKITANLIAFSPVPVGHTARWAAAFITPPEHEPRNKNNTSNEQSEKHVLHLEGF